MDIPTLSMAKAYADSWRLGYEETKPVELLPETDLEFAYIEDYGMIMATTSPTNVAHNDNITLILDGVRYNCVVSGTDTGMSYVGNAGFIGMDDTGEPFFVSFSTDATIWAVAQEGTNTVSVTKQAVEVKQIDEKYIPNGEVLTGISVISLSNFNIFAITEGNEVEEYPNTEDFWNEMDRATIPIFYHRGSVLFPTYVNRSAGKTGIVSLFYTMSGLAYGYCHLRRKELDDGTTTTTVTRVLL